MKNMHPARKTLRIFLYMCVALSLLFIGSIAYLRDNYSALRNSPEIRNAIFHADVYQQRIATIWASDAEDIEITKGLIRNSFYSPIYRRAGLKMLATKAESGYAPAQTLHADIVLAYRLTDSPKVEAARYYELAAAQNYKPAIEKLSILSSPDFTLD